MGRTFSTSFWFSALLAGASGLALSAPATSAESVPASTIVAAPLPTVDLAPANIEAPRLMRLSDEHELSRWAYSETRGKIYKQHSTYSGSKGRLRLYTEDGFPEVYLLMNEYVDSKRHVWVQIRLPGRPNGRKGWVKRSALGPYRTNNMLFVVNRKTLKGTLYKRGKRVWQASVGVGAAGTKTPHGHFWVREKFRFKNKPVYGTHAIGTSAYAPGLSDWPGGGVIGIHGTNEPGLLPGRVSHGCVRVRNKQVLRLYRLIKVGTPVWVR